MLNFKYYVNVYIYPFEEIPEFRCALSGMTILPKNTLVY